MTIAEQQWTQWDTAGHEHRLVIEDISSRLEPLTSEISVPSTPTLRRMANVQHLSTSIQGTLLAGRGLLDVVEAMHPTPAVGGSPTSDAVAMAAEPTIVPTATPTEDPGYIVVTATPTSEAEDAAELPPTFTPLPTATSEPPALLNGFSEWSSEDLVLATLCFVFFGAGGLGVLGITSLSLYLRSRSEAGRRE